MTLHHERHGSGGPRLVILHGLFGSGENWRTPGRRLGERFDVVLADLPNHGRSPHVATMDLGSMAAEVTALLDHLGWPDAHVVGHSLGGKVAMQLAFDARPRVRSLVVVDIAPKATTGENADVLAALRSLDPARLASRAAADAALAAAGIGERGTRQFLLKNLERREGDAAGFRWQLGLDGIAASWAALQAAPRGEPLPDLPALFVRGERSRYVADEDLPEIRRLFSHAAVVTIAGAGHWVHVDRPQETLAAIVEHVGRVELAQ